MALECGPSLIVRNRMRVDARLRFHCGRHALWDTRLQPGVSLDVPDLAYADIEIATCHLDPQTQVASRLSTRIDGGFGRSGVELPRLVAKVQCGAGGSGFAVAQEAHPDAQALGLLNLTGAEVRFHCRFLCTPFECVMNVPPQATHLLRLGHVQLTVTVDGLTTAGLPLLPWRSSAATIEPSHDSGEPRLQWSPAGP
ncbi:hypothetical protein [Xanthomonas rydalmerensis]|uniref:Uncharacterized protein n=1 Tax=Xanthomonas rydalmerensis TaxID=3046274 RepID=A0ABZ0JMW9_9XANT|nr:hypothetical protein [Xanthomonas sp. DM-2023]WOS41151.1 hypothetical protein QN243_01310 [Xanthomonas sp. DM-2023]WOS45336.1 hypothetical protein QN242_01310 [Xanthomonas sp. DM-2023]WOS49515.1 hypothetical protein QN240_01310 [Xanthomonas sp. DM-2023]WOS53695.1 hypothetical protein QN244_01310 [Xanthomonas sp. DM-2023]WOS57878.1 hypothetical protein QN245_01310 [Xanthomonas sp. DM-2023]